MGHALPLPGGAVAHELCPARARPGSADADDFCKRFYGMNCTVLPGYVAHTTPTPTYPKMHKRGGCTSQGLDIPNTMCDNGPCKIGNWSETTQGLANLICRCL
jgi:hypothetical protein